MSPAWHVSGVAVGAAEPKFEPVTVTVGAAGVPLSVTPEMLGAKVDPTRKGCSCAQVKTMLAGAVALGLTTKMAS